MQSCVDCVHLLQVVVLLITSVGISIGHCVYQRKNYSWFSEALCFHDFRLVFREIW